MNSFSLTERQREALKVCAGPASNVMLFGGSRSGKTFLHVRNLVMRALKAPKSRHAAFRFRFNAIKSSIISDTFPRVMELAYPGQRYELNKTDWFAEFDNGSELWFGGLDEKERTEKILGMEFATILLNECSQIPQASADMVATRLSQRVMQSVAGREPTLLLPRMFYDENPPTKGWWTYKRFILKIDPETREPLKNPEDYAAFQINPQDNADNLAPEYFERLQALPGRMQKRFFRGEYADATPNQLFNEDDIEKWRAIDGSLPDMLRIVVAVDPSGAGDQNNADNDEIGIAVAGLGTNGIGYLLEDCSVKAGPATWGNVATGAFERHAADSLVAEINFGGAMVEHVIKTSRPRTPFKMLTASRGKVQRAEPIAALYEQGKIRHAGIFRRLEDELAQFSTVGYLGEGSPNRADAAIWAFSELFPGIVQPRKPMEKIKYPTLGIA